MNACAVKCGVNNNDPYDWELPKKPVDKESNRVDHKLSSSEKERPQLISSKDTCECLEGKGAKKKKRKVSNLHASGKQDMFEILYYIELMYEQIRCM